MSEVPIVAFNTIAIEYDACRDVVTIEGIRYAGGLFRGLGLKTALGAWIQIVSRSDGTLTLRGTRSPAPFCPECGAEANAVSAKARHRVGCPFTFPGAG